MFYKPCNNPNEARTDGYMFSVKTKQDPNLLKLKDDVRRHNKASRTLLREHWEARGEMPGICDGLYSLQRVTCMARGHRATWAALEYGNRRSFDQSLPHRYAEYFDVYRGIDSYAMYNLRRELSEGYSLSMLKKLDEAAFAVSDARWQQVFKLVEDGVFETQSEARDYLKNRNY